MCPHMPPGTTFLARSRSALSMGPRVGVMGILVSGYFRHCERSEAIQRPQHSALDCFGAIAGAACVDLAAMRLAMTRLRWLATILLWLQRLPRHRGRFDLRPIIQHRDQLAFRPGLVLVRIPRAADMA